MCQNEIKMHCIEFYKAFVEVSNHELSDKEIEDAFNKYIEFEKSPIFKRLSSADMTAIFKTIKICWQDKQNFERAIDQVLTKRGINK
ncbi:hypothetical protein ACFOEW_11490 [Alteromonas oceani]|uniref:Phage protein n=1 Tax=Alteromonas oceani TaxID=2071609 RepID=A0ABV7JZC2_9ALTE|nr:hypothetical protein [Alteromonas oceani]